MNVSSVNEPASQSMKRALLARVTSRESGRRYRSRTRRNRSIVIIDRPIDGTKFIVASCLTAAKRPNRRAYVRGNARAGTRTHTRAHAGAYVAPCAIPCLFPQSGES